MKIERVAVEVIDVGVRLRPVNDAAIVVLAESLQRLGQLSPISVYHSDGKTHLVTGLHRLEAAKRLKWKKILAVVVASDEIERELQEIAENLHRAELAALERDIQIARWIELTAAKARHLDEPLPGGKQPSEKGQAKAARELCISEPDARRAAKVASMSPEAKQAARDAGLDDNRSALLAVARESTPEGQVAKVAAIKAAKSASRAASQRGSHVETDNIVSFAAKIDRAAQNGVNQQAIDHDGLDDNSSASAESDVEGRAHAFRDALSTMDIVSIAPHKFWAVFGETLKAETVKKVDAAWAKLNAIKQAIPGAKAFTAELLGSLSASEHKQLPPSTNTGPDERDIPVFLDRRHELRAADASKPRERVHQT